MPQTVPDSGCRSAEASASAKSLHSDAPEGIPLDPASSPALAYYVSAHGYGHGVRSCDILRELNALRPGLRIYVVSDLPASFFRNRLESPSNIPRPASFDVGMVQFDSIRVDVPATLHAVEALYERRRDLVEQEALFLKTHRVGAIVVDIPALPLEAAALADVPRLAVGNFAWDWIYSAYLRSEPRWGRIIRAFRESYAKTDLLLRLPFAEKMRAFPHIEDIPLVASPGLNRRGEIAGIAGCPAGKRWILVSFASLMWDDQALDSVERLSGYEFFTVRPLAFRRRNLHAIDRERIPFSDIVASVDGVLSKPGFGIMSECVVNRKPLIYADRADFLEYTVLEQAIPRYLKHVHIPAERLYRGELLEALAPLDSLPDPPLTLRRGGAEAAARRILEFVPP